MKDLKLDKKLKLLKFDTRYTSKTSNSQLLPPLKETFKTSDLEGKIVRIIYIHGHRDQL